MQFSGLGMGTQTQVPNTGFHWSFHSGFHTGFHTDFHFQVFTNRLPDRFSLQVVTQVCKQVCVNIDFPRSDTHLDMGEIHATEQVGSLFSFANSFHIVTLHSALTENPPHKFRISFAISPNTPLVLNLLSVTSG